jgi:Protein of unknown function (DUF3102)
VSAYIDLLELPLPDLAVKINDFANKAEGYARSAMDIAVATGGLLLIAREKVSHGEWEAWLTDNCTLAPRTARAYMRLANNIKSLPEQERQRVADLPVREAIRAITTTADAPQRSGMAVYQRRTDAERSAAVLRKGADAMRDAAKWIGGTSMLPGKKITSLRTKLQAALDELNRLESGGEGLESVQ